MSLILAIWSIVHGLVAATVKEGLAGTKMISLYISHNNVLLTDNFSSGPKISVELVVMAHLT